VEYDGTVYHGFQRQKGQATVQEALETALRRVTQEDIRIVGAGRTDTGVHALGQVVHFQTATRLDPVELQRALNALLPADIAVRDAADVEEGFHARFSARSRQYRYTILNTPVRSPLRRRGVAHVSRPLDIEAMQAAAHVLIGTHDFASFGGGMREGGSTERTVYSLTVCREASTVRVTIAANAYLSRMVRAIVGCLIAVGLGEATAEQAACILAAKNRSLVTWLAPPQGLCLMAVEY
jgi:tRNA pseudouridine38-40 synthase